MFVKHNNNENKGQLLKRGIFQTEIYRNMLLMVIKDTEGEQQKDKRLTEEQIRNLHKANTGKLKKCSRIIL